MPEACVLQEPMTQPTGLSLEREEGQGLGRPHNSSMPNFQNNSPGLRLKHDQTLLPWLFQHQGGQLELSKASLNNIC